MNPKLYYALYPQSPDWHEEDADAEDGFFIPQNDEELAQLMQRLNVQRIS